MSKERIRREEYEDEVATQRIIEKESKPVEHEHKSVYCVFLHQGLDQWEELVKVFRNEKDADNYIQSIHPVVHYKLQFELE